MCAEEVWLAVQTVEGERSPKKGCEKKKDEVRTITYLVDISRQLACCDSL